MWGYFECTDYDYTKKSIKNQYFFLFYKCFTWTFSSCCSKDASSCSLASIMARSASKSSGDCAAIIS